MRKRSIFIQIALITALMALPAFDIIADVQVKPYPPSWVSESDYVIFADTEAYLEENWADIIKMRTLAESGTEANLQELKTMVSKYPMSEGFNNGEYMNYDPGLQYELVLISYQMYLTGKNDVVPLSSRLTHLLQNKRIEESNQLPIILWNIRSITWRDDILPGYPSLFTIAYLYEGYDRIAFLSHKDFDKLRRDP